MCDTRWQCKLTKCTPCQVHFPSSLEYTNSLYAYQFLNLKFSAATLSGSVSNVYASTGYADSAGCYVFTMSSCPDVYPMPTQTCLQGGRVHYTHAEAETWCDCKQSLVVSFADKTVVCCTESTLTSFVGTTGDSSHKLYASQVNYSIPFTPTLTWWPAAVSSCMPSVALLTNVAFISYANKHK